MDFAKAGSSDIVNAEQRPVLAPQFRSIAALNQGVSKSLHGTRHLGMLSWYRREAVR